MSLNGHLFDVIGKKIAHVITSEQSFSAKKIFLVFEDDTSMEFYGDIQNAKGLSKGTYDETLRYAKLFGGVIKEYSGNATLQTSDFTTQNADEMRLIRLFRCLNDSDKNDHLRDISCHLLTSIPIHDYTFCANPQKSALEELKEDLEYRLHCVMPSNSVFSDLHDYDYRPAELAWDSDVIDVLLGTADDCSDAYNAESLVQEYLRGAEEFNLPLPCDFDDGDREEAYEDMVHDLQRQAVEFIREWREKIISLLETPLSSETIDNNYLPISVGDGELDFMMSWDTAWEPSAYDECIKEFVTFSEEEDAGDDEEVEEEFRDGVVNLRRLVLHLKKIASHIDWRVEIKGCDDDYGGGSSWEGIAVPSDQLHDAETVIERIESSGDIMKFTGPKDFAGQLYDERGKLRAEVTEFASAVYELKKYVSLDFRHHQAATRKDREEQIMYLIRLLAELYAAGSRLSRLENSAYVGEYPCDSMSTEFQDTLLENYGQFMKKRPGDYDSNPFEQITYACECLDAVQEMYDDNNLFDVAKAVAEWQFGFRSSGGWAISIVDALQDLHKIYAAVRHAR